MKPQLDHFIGRQADNVFLNDDGTWSISMTGSVLLHCNSSEVGTPTKELTGAVLLSATDVDDTTEIAFGRAGDAGMVVTFAVTIPRSDYVISVQGMEHSPDEPEETFADALPPDPSPERVADGPTEAQEPPE